MARKDQGYSLSQCHHIFINSTISVTNSMEMGTKFIVLILHINTMIIVLCLFCCMLLCCAYSVVCYNVVLILLFILCHVVFILSR